MYPLYRDKSIKDILELPDEQLLKDFKQMLEDLDKAKDYGIKQIIPINDTGLHLGLDTKGDWL